MKDMSLSDDCPDPVRDALAHGESTPETFASWSLGECLRRLRTRFGYTRGALVARAGVSASLVGRAEQGADVRVSTIRKLYAALGCRVVLLPAGALYELDWRQAHNDDASIESEKEIERLITGGVPEGWEEAPEG